MAKEGLGFSLEIPDEFLKDAAKADLAIEQLAKRSEDSSARIVTAFKQMSDMGVQPFLDKLNMANASLANFKMKEVKIPLSGAEQYSDTIAKTILAVNKLNTSEDQSRKIYVDKISMYSQMFDRIERNEKAIERQASVQRKLNAAQADATTKASLGTYDGAMGSAKEANTIAQRVTAINNLKRARQDLDTTTESGKRKLQDLNKAILENEQANKKAVAGSKELQKAHSSAGDVAGQLTRKLALIFSVSQIQGYVMNMIKVRGEFELQNRALQAILQNKDEADKLFGRITELAIRSPFQVKELVTYTKQLAAYRVETEKLYDTTKMLADVSAGLGVDMSRLILAYGQVKAANYLRGTELRQFSEAGINILGELSTYYTELEGRMVSVGDVQERVTKRMVAFGDVEEIFKRITSAGGIFYNMQEIQAETLAGQMSNLADSIDIMFNAIGQANDSSLKDAVALVRTLVENWETIAITISSAIVPYLAYKTVLLAIIGYEKIRATLIAAGNANLLIQNALIVKSKDGQMLFNKATKANPWLIAGAAVLSIIMGVAYALKKAGEEQAKLNSLASDGFFESNRSAANYERLASVVADSTKSYEEQKAALDELKRTYSDILPKHNLEAEAIRNMAGNYDTATSAIKNYVRAKTEEKQLQLISETYEPKVKESGEDLAERIQDQVESMYDYEMSIGEVNVVLAKFREEFDKGFIKSPEEAKKKIRELLSVDTGQDMSKIDLYRESRSDFGTDKDFAGDFYKSLVTLDKRTNEILGNSANEFGSLIKRRFTGMYDGIKKQVDDANKYINIISQKEKVGTPGSLVTKAQVSESIVALQKYFDYIGLASIKASDITDDSVFIKETSLELNKKVLENFYSYISKMSVDANEVVSKNRLLQTIQEDIDKIDGTKAQKEIKRLALEYAALNNISLDGMEKVFLGAEENVSDYAGRLGQAIKDLQERIALFNLTPALTEWTPVDAKKAKEQLGLFEHLSERVTIEKPKKGPKGPKGEDPMKARISIIKEAGKAYEDYLKYYDKETAKLKTRESYKDAFKAADIEDMAFSMDFDVSGVIAGLETLLKSSVGKTRKLIEKEIADLKTKVDIEVEVKNLEAIQRQVDDVFSGYEFSLELEKTGMGSDLMKQIFNVDTLDLDGVRKKIEELYPDVSKLGTEELKKREEALRRLAGLEENHIKEQAKKYAQYLIKSKDERIAIKEDELRQTAEMEKLEKFTPEQKEQIKTKIQKESTQKIAKVDYEDLKATDLYKKSFEDLERLGTTSLNIMLVELQRFAKESGQALDPASFKELTNNIKNMRDEVEVRNPFDSLIDGIAEYKQSLEDLKTAQAEYDAAQAEAAIAQENKKTAQVQVEQAQVAVTESPEEERAAAVAKLWVAQTNLTTATNTATAADNKKAAASKKVAKAEDDQADALTKAGKAISKAKNNFDKLGSAIMDSVDLAKDLAEGLGMSFSPETNAIIDSMGKAIQLVSAAMAVMETITLITDLAAKVLMSTLWPLLAIALALAAVFAIVAIGDAKKEAQIKKEQERVEILQEAYEKLEKAIDNAYSMDEFKQSTKNASKNITEQISSYRNMISAEQDKKKTDDDAIKGWEKDIRKLQEQQKALIPQLIEGLGGFGTDENFKSAADDFSSAWLDAFNETGDGLSGLTETFDEFINNMLKKQIMLRLSKQYITPILDTFDKMFGEGSAGGESVVKSELDALKELANNKLAGFNEEAMKLMGSLGLTPTGEGGELSGLSKGIAGISEESAQALEALLSSSRMFLASTDATLTNLYNSLTSGNVESNPMLAELRIQTIQISSINKLLNSVTKGGHKQGGDGLKVFID